MMVAAADHALKVVAVNPASGAAELNCSLLNSYERIGVAALPPYSSQDYVDVLVLLKQSL